MNECDSCGNPILQHSESPVVLDDRHYHRFALPVEEEGEGSIGEYTIEVKEYTLCSECQRIIVDFIDECSEGEVLVEMLDLVRTAKVLDEYADLLSGMARELDEFSRGKDDE